MNDSAASPELIPEDEARYQVESYLKSRYHEFEKIKFDSCELCQSEPDKIYRFNGTIMIKSRSTLDRFVVAKTSSTYQFLFEISAVNGQIINYVFT